MDNSIDAFFIYLPGFSGYSLKNGKASIGDNIIIQGNYPA